jgi:hypothetical protein
LKNYYDYYILPGCFYQLLRVCRAAAYALNGYPGRSTVCRLREKKCRKKLLWSQIHAVLSGRNCRKKYNIRVIPVHIIYPEGEYEDGVDIDPKMVYQRFPREIPTTSMPSFGEVQKFLEGLKEEGYTHCISINVSDHLSGTVNTVRSAAEEVEGLGNLCLQYQGYLLRERGSMPFMRQILFRKGFLSVKSAGAWRKKEKIRI